MLKNIGTGFRAGFVLAFTLMLGFCPAPMIAAGPPQRPQQYWPAAGEFDDISKAVVELLQSHDTARFVNAVTPKLDDWKSALSTNSTAAGANTNNFAVRSRFLRRRLELNAQSLLDKTTSLHLDFSKGNLHPEVILPKQFGSIRYSGPNAESLPYAEKMEIVLHPDSVTNSPGKGEFKLALLGMVKFPTGWRLENGIMWESFPANLVDKKTERDLMLMAKVTARESITGEDDPALIKLGEALVRFVRDRNITNYEKDALINADLEWGQFQKMKAFQSGKGPSRQELDDHVKGELELVLKSARALLKQMDDAGIDLTNADIQIKAAGIQNAQTPGGAGAGSLDFLMGSQFNLELAVKTDAKARNGTPLSGDYVMSAKQIQRFGGEWKVSDDSLHWSHLPSGILDEKAAAAMETENYVSQYGTLPPHSAAPEIEFTTLVDQKKMKLSDLRGKVVLLDFWATWCGPCQDPMAELQTLQKDHPEWQDKVVIMPLSIDDTISIVQKHVNQRNWTNTFNVWAGEGGWHSKPATAFRVTGVPTTYIIDADGKIVQAGHPAGMDFAKIIEPLLKSSAYK